MSGHLTGLEGMLSASNVGIWQMHVPSGRFTRNDVFARLTQMSPEELDRGVSTWADCIHAADREAFKEERRRLFAGEIDSYCLDYRIRRIGGGWISLRARVAALEQDSAGQPIWVGAVVTDITRERELERRMQALFDRPFQFIGLLTPQGVLIETNRVSVEDSGRKPEDFLNRLFWELPFFSHSPSLQRQLKAGIARAAAGELVRFEMATPRGKEGAVRTVDFSLTPMRDDDGNVINVIPESRDITELVRTREALRQTEQRLNAATQAANIGPWEWNVQTNQAWFGDQWYRMRGLNPNALESESMDRTPWIDLVHPDDRSRVLSDMKALHEGAIGETLIEYRMRLAEGPWRWFQTKGRAIEHDEQGRVRRIAGVSTDITERKEAESRLAAAERLESIGRLASGVAHEINTPVQYVNDSVYFVREGVQELLKYISGLQPPVAPGSEPAPDIAYLQAHLPAALDRAADGLARVAEIVRSMKDFSHVDQGVMGEIDLNRSVQSTLVVARSEYKHVASVEANYGELPPITCHGGQINQAVLNLLVNAAHAIADVVKGTEERGLITIRTYRDGDDAVISISDTGRGIPESIRHRIFDPFFTTKQVGSGTGQGLSIVHNIVVKEHGGSVTFDSSAATGARFLVRLPISRHNQQSAAHAA